MTVDPIVAFDEKDAEQQCPDGYTQHNQKILHNQNALYISFQKNINTAVKPMQNTEPAMAPQTGALKNDARGAGVPANPSSCAEVDAKSELRIVFS